MVWYRTLISNGVSHVVHVDSGDVTIMHMFNHDHDNVIMSCVPVIMLSLY